MPKTQTSIHSIRVTARAVFCLICISLAAAPSKAQDTDPLESVGSKVDSTTLPVPSGYVDLANNDLHIEIPVGTFSQRGEQTVEYSLMYDSAIWSQANGSHWAPAQFITGFWGAGWRLVNSADPGSMLYTTTEGNFCNIDGSYGTITLKNFAWAAADGHVVHFPTVVVQYGYTNRCTTWPSIYSSGRADDASGYFLNVTATGTTVYSPSGFIVYCSDSSVISAASAFAVSADTNGNYSTITTSSPDVFTDTLGRTPISVSTVGSTTTISVLNTQNTTSNFVITNETVNYSTNFGSGLAEYSGSATAIQSISLPDGSSYSFGYDSGTTPGHYAQLTSINLPTGAHISYQYANFVDSMYGPGTGGKHITRGVSQITTPDGVSNLTNQVVVQCTTSSLVNCKQTTTVAKPSGDHSVYTFQINDGTWPIQIQHYNGAVSSANLLASIAQTFDFSQPCTMFCAIFGEAQNVTKTAKTLTLPSVGGVSLNQTTQYAWSTTTNYGNLLNDKEWMFYTGTLPTSADRTTAFTYLNTANYITANILNRVTQSLTLNSSGGIVSKTLNSFDGVAPTLTSGIVHHDDTHYGVANTTRGNLTQLQELISGSTYATSSDLYDTTGQVLSAMDPDHNPTTYSYSDNFFKDGGDTLNPIAYPPPSPTNAFVHTATFGGLTTTFGYYWGTGVRASKKDSNNATTYYHFYDPLSRATSIIFPDHGWTLYRYFSPTLLDTFSGITTTTPTPTCTGCRFDRTTLDSTGRVEANTIESDPAGYDSTGTTYDSNGRISTRSNSHRVPTDPTYGVAQYFYDGLDRVTEIIDADGSVSHTYYGAAVTAAGGATSQLCSSSTYGLGYPVLHVDEAGKKRQQWVDGFGRVIEIDEPTAAGSLSVPSCYSYDLNNNLTGVVQGSETRTFGYDALSRMTSATDPESGQVKYTYDNAGNVLTRTSPAPNQTNPAVTVTTTYQLDSMERVTKETYSDGTTPTVNFLYDTSAGWSGVTQTNLLGRLSEEWTTLGAVSQSGSVFGYDAVGRITTNNQCTPLTCGPSNYPVQFAYDLYGDLTSYANGGGQTLTQVFDNATHATSVTSSLVDSQHPATLETANQFFPFGPPELVTYGNGVKEVYLYNTRLQLCRINVNTTAIAPVSFQHCNDNLGYTTLQDFSLQYNEGVSDNGALSSFNGTTHQLFQRSYTYDQLNRISGVTDSQAGAQCGQMSFGYDIWGNLLTKTPIVGSCPNWSQTVSTNNQYVGFSYDAVGNLLNDGTHNYFYDAENRLIQVDGVSGNCAAGTGSPTACYAYDAEGRRVEKKTLSGAVDFTYNRSGQILGEMTSAGLTLARIYLDGSPVAIYFNNTTYFVHRDHLGSTRLVTTMTQSVAECDDYFPFGESITCTPGANIDVHKFTDKERDSESNLDDFEARFYSSQMGRFMSPNPTGGRPAFPQSWNAYSYVVNSPLSAIDPIGLDCAYFNPSGTGISYIDQFNTPLGCMRTGGAWAPGTITDVTFDPTSNQVLLTYAYRDVEGAIEYSKVTATPGQFNSSDSLYAIAGDINQWNITANAFKIYGLGAGFGGAVGAGCYAACPWIAQNVLHISTGVITLGATVGGTPGPPVTSAELQAVVNEMFQIGDRLPNGLAGVVRYELRTGDFISPASHVQEAGDTILRINSLLKDGTFSLHDQIVAKQLIQDLRDALKTAPFFRQ